MLTEREYLLLCELSSTGAVNPNIDTVDKMALALIGNVKPSEEELLKEAAANTNFAELKAKDSILINKIRIYVFDDSSGDTAAVFLAEGDNESDVNKDCFDEICEFLRKNFGTGKCVVTGLKAGGIYAAYTAQSLELEGILFGAPSTEELPGNIVNYVGENEPVGNCLGKVSFIKQIPFEEELNDDIDKPYSRTFIFDEKGRPVKGEQTAFSKMVSRFYSNTDNVNKDILKIFFNDMEEKDTLIDVGFYSVFLKIDEFSSERIEKSLSEVIKYIENELKKNAESFHSDFDRILREKMWDEDGFEEKVVNSAEKASNNAGKIIGDAYTSVETILTGIGLFKMDKDDIEITSLIEQFAGRVDTVLTEEIKRLNEFLDGSWQRYLNYLSVFEEYDTEDI